jgi:hypothetical protein
MVQLLLDHGVGSKNNNYTHAVHIAFSRGHKGIVEALFPHGERFSARIFFRRHV